MCLLTIYSILCYMFSTVFALLSLLCCFTVHSAHFKMMPSVPLAGWDVAFTTQGIFLLEANLSCNFFKGTFDKGAYIDLVDAYWRELDPQLD